MALLRRYLRCLALAIFFGVLWTASVSSQVDEGSDGGLVVEADGSLQWLREAQQYIASGGARAMRGGTRLEAEVIVADYIEAESAVAGESNISITYIEGRGGREAVRFTHERLVAEGAMITYDLGADYAVVTSSAGAESGGVGSGGVVSGDFVSRLTHAEGRLTALDRIIYDRKKRVLMAYGQAHIVLSDGRQLKGAVITARLNSAEDAIIYATASGGAEVLVYTSQGVTEAFAEDMRYDLVSGIAVLSENVVLKEAGNVLRGEEAVIDTNSGVSTMSGSGSVGGTVGGEADGREDGREDGGEAGAEGGGRVGGVFLPPLN